MSKKFPPPPFYYKSFKTPKAMHPPNPALFLSLMKSIPHFGELLNVGCCLSHSDLSGLEPHFIRARHTEFPCP